MSNQLICDDCGQPIDQSEPYYTLTGQLVQMVATEANPQPVLTSIEASVSLDYHKEHVPGYKVAGQEVDVNAPTT